jgi:hypothetical protein
MRSIREAPRYRELGMPRHEDPEFETFTYGDYPWKPAKVNLGRTVPGDWIFFNETLVIGGVKGRFTIGCFHVEERISYDELREGDLVDDARYAGNAHLARNRLIPESDTRFTIWRGGPGSRLLARPLPMNRAFIETLGLRDQRGQPWDWAQCNAHGRPFSELELIASHTRATRLLDERQTRWLLDQLEPQSIHAPA